MFNVGTTHELTIGELAERVRALAGSASPIVLVPYDEAYQPGFEDLRRRVPDIRKAERVVGYRPRVSARRDAAARDRLPARHRRGLGQAPRDRRPPRLAPAAPVDQEPPGLRGADLLPGSLLEPGAGGPRSVLAFVLFCLLSGGIYLINDVIDAERDRSHPQKRHRPVASGRLPAAGRARRRGSASSSGPRWRGSPCRRAFGVVAVAYAALLTAYSAGSSTW